MRRVLPIAVLAVVLSGCAGKSGDVAASPEPSAASTSPASSPSASPSPSTATSPSPTAPAVDQTIAITYAGGKVSGVPAVVKVKHNSTVALVVTSDVGDEVHVHGYDKSADVANGGTVRIVFKATLQGRFDVELEKLGRRLVVVQVS